MWLAIWLHVQVIFNLPKECSKTDVVGCYMWNENHVHVKQGYDKSHTDAIIYHELAHYCGYRKESDADAWAFMFMSGKLGPRSKEFLSKAVDCEKGIRDIIK